MTYGRRIREARSWAGLSQTKLAESLEVVPSAVANWEAERHSPSTATLQRIAELCGLSMAEFWGAGPETEAG